MGGEAAVKTATVANLFKELNFKAAVALEPAVYWVNTTHPEDIGIPTFFATGSNDTLAYPESVEDAYDKDKFGDKIIVNIEGGDHLEDIDTGKRRTERYWLAFLRCWIKEEKQACGYVYETGEDTVCNNQLFPKARCEVTHQKATSFLA